jgi:hypothetical protein
VNLSLSYHTRLIHPEQPGYNVTVVPEYRRPGDRTGRWSRGRCLFELEQQGPFLRISQTASQMTGVFGGRKATIIWIDDLSENAMKKSSLI